MGKKDLTNTYIDNIYIKYMDETKEHGAGKARYWICVCPICKQEFSVRQNHLIGENHIKMCANCNRTKREDLTGNKYGRLKVDYMLPFEKYKRTKCSCTCDCGTTNIIVQANHLKAREIQSCGCITSLGEEKIAHLLIMHNIIFEKQKTFKDCVYEGMLRFDFYLPIENLVIEYNGIQHYKPVDFFGGEKELLHRQKLDNIKKQYCKDHNISYLEISYKDNIEQVLSTII